MRRASILMAVFVILVSGCASHYLRPEGDDVRLYLRQRAAARVQVATSLDGFRLHEARRVSGGKWVVVMPGKVEFSYFFVVDEQVLVPACRLHEKDDFGSVNCLYIPGR